MPPNAGHRLSTFHRLALTATVLALCVVVLGAWVRLTHAGLGCPDWPGCYGQLTVPSSDADVAVATDLYPERPVEQGKAWREMIHRYFAGALGLLVAGLGVLAIRNRSQPGQPVTLPLALVGLIVFQALLGMWTVTLLLKPLVVMAHLLGGMATLALLWWLALVTRSAAPAASARQGPLLRRAAALGLVLLIGQIALGGWTSTNYAALACPDFPTCMNEWWPDADFGEAFVLWRGLGVDYEGGVLQHPARVAIHLTHRLGAIVIALFLGTLCVAALRRGVTPGVRRAAIFVGAALVAQISIGIAVVKLGLPLAVAVAHNGTAALLLLAVVALNFAMRQANGL